MKLLTSGHLNVTLTKYFGFSYLVNLFVFSQFLAFAQQGGASSWFYLAAIILTYPLIYMAPIIFPALLATKFLPKAFHQSRHRKTAFSILILCTVLLSAALTLTIYSDYRLFELYRFHINAFVINLIFTPGGVASMGGSIETYVYSSLFVLFLVLIHSGLFLLASKLRFKPSKKQVSFLIISFVSLTLSERVLYGLSDIKQYGAILKSAELVPLYNRVTFRGSAEKLGLELAVRNDISVKPTSGKSNYPLKPITVANAIGKQPNIIWLVAESLRRDMMNQDIMPYTYNMSKTAWRLDNHYSGGNGTRQGMFSLFYGIYGSYWDCFLIENKSPVLLDLLQQQGYQTNMFTSADFTYPEFDQTLFAKIPNANMHQLSNQLSPWQRDQKNTENLISGIKARDANKPFMSFMFYESTHARYDFPASSVIREPYLRDINYASMTRTSLAPKIGELKNRYINASHFIDSQLERIYQTLSDEGLWQNTIVVVTGDHGEEFMENGFWGHNSGFSEQQIQSPMVIWLPGEKPRVIHDRTSHMDIVPTVLAFLGVENPVSDYSLGQDLSKPLKRDYLVVSDWAGVAFLNEQYKFSVPFSSSLALRNQLFDSNDQEVSDIVPFLTEHKAALEQIMKNMKLFMASK